jgi:DNA polymerase III delta prime subunit
MHNQLLSEYLRPQTLAEVTLPDHLILSLERCVERGSIPNMLFYGRSVIGKTSTARILLRELDADVMELNGSSCERDKTFVNRIEGFTHTVSLYGRPKVCFIDEADHMSKGVQDALRYIIEQVSDNARFILTANDHNRLTDAIKSRCMPICFDIPRKDQEQVLERMVENYKHKLAEAGHPIGDDTVRKVVSIYFPDFRNIANHFQMEI